MSSNFQNDAKYWPKTVYEKQRNRTNGQSFCSYWLIKMNRSNKFTVNVIHTISSIYVDSFSCNNIIRMKMDSQIKKSKISCNTIVIYDNGRNRNNEILLSLLLLLLDNVLWKKSAVFLIIFVSLINDAIIFFFYTMKQIN